MPPNQRQSKTLGKRKRQQDSPEAEDQTQPQDLAHSIDEATLERLRQAYPFLTHTRQAFVEGTLAHKAATSRTRFPTQEELARWRSKGGNPTTYPTRLGNLAEWLREVAAMQPLLRPNTQRARAIARARAEQAEARAEAEAEAAAQQSDAETETTGSAEETISQSTPRASSFKAKRSRSGNSSTSDANAGEEEGEVTPSIGKEARILRPRGSVSGARRIGKRESPSPVPEPQEVKSQDTPTKWITLRLPRPKPPGPQIPGLKYEVGNEIACESIESVNGSPAYDSEETTDDPDLIEMKEATSILMSMAADEEAGRQIEEAKVLMSKAADQENDGQVGATSEHEAAEPLTVVSESSGGSPDAVEGIEHTDGESDEQQAPGVPFARAPVRLTFNLAHAPSRITNRPPKLQNESLLGPPTVNEDGRAVKPKKRKYNEVEETYDTGEGQTCE